MTADDLLSEIARLTSEIEARPENRHELYLALREKLNEIRAMGMPLPDDLVRFERELEAEFAAHQHRRSAPAQSPRRRRKPHRD